MPLAVRAVAFASTPFLFLAGGAFVYRVLALLLDERLHRWVLSDAPKAAQFMFLARDDRGGHRGEFPHFLWGFARFQHFAQAVAATAGHFLVVLDVVESSAHADGAIIRGDLPPVLHPVSLGSSALNAVY